MAFVYFTEKDTNQSVAVNTKNVSMVREKRSFCELVFVDNTVLYIADPYLDTVARLNNPGL